MARIFHRIGMIALSGIIAVVTFAAILAAGIIQSGQPSSAPPLTPPQTALANAQHRDTPALPGTFTVAVVLGQSGTDTADALAPYEVLTSSPAFSVYTVSDSLQPAALDGGLAVAPDYTFADVESGATPAPDLIVVPGVNLPDGPEEQAARAFITAQYSAGARVLSICTGSRLLAASGILDGSTATSHWSRISALEESRPAVTWVRGERYVQDGRITTTGGVTSGIPGTLKVIADMAGAAEATRVGTQVGHPGWSLDAPTQMPARSFGTEDAEVLLNTTLPWSRPNYTVELNDGVGEIDAAALFEVYTYSQAATTNAVSATGTVHTRHGLTILTGVTGTDTDSDTLVAGSLTGHRGFGGFDAAIEQLARSTGPGVAVSVGKMLEYPLDRVTLSDTSTPDRWRAPALLATAVLLAAAFGAIPYAARRLWRRR
ncbi:DJ-1/PfpI family protein [uncultured Microbacterium sp.]|uniref:DJ-1/PfpI family protein n=1 Tax=uncultured Microbacterium sp. TaxID=191216 RepID=UPI0028D1ADF5|nr:DJ-1/PfpI family protein [uncultured Microbacterium sp.]